MTSTPPTPVKKRKRLSPEERRSEIIESAIQFFALEGFDSPTRDLAEKLGITQPLLYRYFKSKDELIAEVYQSVYVKRWRDDWDQLLRDRSKSLQDRIREFYSSYATIAFERDWMRIFFFAGLKGMDLNRSYLKRVEDRLLKLMIAEFRFETGLEEAEPSQTEIDIAWVMHGAIYYCGIRMVIYERKGPERVEEIVDHALTGFVNQLREALAAKR